MEIKLSTTSYLALGLVARLQPCTSYDLKRMVRETIEHFWSFPHSQLYAEPERLTAAGYLKEQREAGGRKRRTFTITAKGRKAIADWLKEPAAEPTEIRDLGLLKLFFGDLASPDEVQRLAQQQAEFHRRRLAEYETLCATRNQLQPQLAYPFVTLEMGLLFEKAAVAFWLAIVEQPINSQQRLQPQRQPDDTNSQDNADAAGLSVDGSASQKRTSNSVDLPDHLL